MNEMNAKQVVQPAVTIEQEKFLAVIHELMGAGKERAGGERPRTAGPWDSIVRLALDRIAGGQRFGETVALNPQPLPPRYVFLSAVIEALANRAELLQEIADAASDGGTQQGIIIVGGYTNRFADQWRRNDFRLNWPHPGPAPPWFPDELQGIDLVVMGARLDKVSQETFSPDLRGHLATAGAKFAEAGLLKIR